MFLDLKLNLLFHLIFRSTSLPIPNIIPINIFINTSDYLRTSKLSLKLIFSLFSVLSPLLWVEPVGQEDRLAEQLSQVVVFFAYILANSLMQQNSLF